MAHPRRALAVLSLALCTALLGAGACSDVVVVQAASDGATSGSSGGARPSGAGGSQSGSGGGTGGAAPVDLSWQRTAVDDLGSGPIVAADSAGNVVVAGAFQGTMDLGGGALVSAMGGMGWSAFVVKLDATGHVLWSHSFDNAVDGLGLAVDGLDDVLLAGDFRGTTDFGGGPLTSADDHDLYVAKLDPDGNHLYSRSFGDGGGGVARAREQRTSVGSFACAEPVTPRARPSRLARTLRPRPALLAQQATLPTGWTPTQPLCRRVRSAIRRPGGTADTPTVSYPQPRIAV